MIETWSFFRFVFLKNFTKSQKWYHCYSRSTLLSVLITKFVHEYNILWVFWLIFDHFISKKICLFRHQILIIWKTCLWNPPHQAKLYDAKSSYVAQIYSDNCHTVLKNFVRNSRKLKNSQISKNSQIGKNSREMETGSAQESKSKDETNVCEVKSENFQPYRVVFLKCHIWGKKRPFEGIFE